MTRKETMEALQEIKEFLEAKGFMVIALFLQGSQNYDLAQFDSEYQSDIDCKAFVVPSFKDMYYNTPFSKTLEQPYGLVDVKDVRLIMDLIKKANPSYIELLYTDYKIVDPKFDELLTMADDMVNEKLPLLMRAINGMALQKHKALKHPYPSVVERLNKFGYDPKQLHHIVRLYFLAKGIKQGKGYKASMLPKGTMKRYLMDLKLGKLPEEDSERLAQAYCDKIYKIVQEHPSNNDTISTKKFHEFEGKVFKVVEDRVLSEWKRKPLRLYVWKRFKRLFKKDRAH